MEQAPLPVAGALRTADRAVEVRNPFSGEVIGYVPEFGVAEADTACRHAAEVLARRTLPQHRRAEILEEAARLLASRVEEFARIIALEAAKPIRTARVEVQRAVDTLVFSAVEARTLAGEMIAMDASRPGSGRLGFALRVPIGPVVAISPFNFPLNLVAHKIGPAIAAGCPVVLKPASQTPFSALRLTELLVEAGLPTEWISVVTGSGRTVGHALISHPVPRLISFTGSPEVGWDIQRLAGRKKVLLELGSNSPVIVEPDADTAVVATKLKVAGFAHAGQSCISTQRVLVHESIHDSLVDRLVSEVESLVLGDPLEETTDLGPLISASETERVLAAVRAGCEMGGVIVTGGKVTADGILEPTVMTGVPADADLATREVFGPVVVVSPYRSFDDALEAADHSDYGIHAGVFTNDLSKALRALNRLNFGGVIVNDVPTYRADQQPYGGNRMSGNTREGPAYTVDAMTELRFVHLAAGA